MSDKHFSFTYTAPTESERREIEEIRRQYAPEPTGADKLARLRRLNARVKNIAACTAVSLGVAGVLLFGLGMSLTLAWGNFIAGITVSAISIAPMAAASPAYKAVLKKCRKKYGEEILRLSQELLGGN